MSGRRLAVVATVEHHDDPVLSRFAVPSADVPAFAEVLGDSGLGGYEVAFLRNPGVQEAFEQVQSLFEGRDQDDSVLFYFRGVMLTGPGGGLFLAGSDTAMGRPADTALDVAQVAVLLQRSRAGQAVVLLDGRTGGPVDAGHHFRAARSAEWQSRVVIAATARPEPPTFAGLIADGVRSGTADRDRDGFIGIGELHDHLRERDPSVRQWVFGSGRQPYVSRVRRQGSDQMTLIAQLAAAAAGEDLSRAVEARETLRRMATGEGRVAAAAAAALRRTSVRIAEPALDFGRVAPGTRQLAAGVPVQGPPLAAASAVSTSAEGLHARLEGGLLRISWFPTVGRLDGAITLDGPAGTARLVVTGEVTEDFDVATGGWVPAAGVNGVEPDPTDAFPPGAVPQGSTGVQVPAGPPPAVSARPGPYPPGVAPAPYGSQGPGGPAYTPHGAGGQAPPAPYGPQGAGAQAPPGTAHAPNRSLENAGGPPVPVDAPPAGSPDLSRQEAAGSPPPDPGTAPAAPMPPGTAAAPARRGPFPPGPPQPGAPQPGVLQPGAPGIVGRASVGPMPPAPAQEGDPVTTSGDEPARSDAPASQETGRVSTPGDEAALTGGPATTDRPHASAAGFDAAVNSPEASGAAADGPAASSPAVPRQRDATRHPISPAGDTAAQSWPGSGGWPSSTPGGFGWSSATTPGSPPAAAESGAISGTPNAPEPTPARTGPTPDPTDAPANTPTGPESSPDRMAPDARSDETGFEPRRPEETEAAQSGAASAPGADVPARPAGSGGQDVREPHPNAEPIGLGSRESHPTAEPIDQGSRESHPTAESIGQGPREPHPTAGSPESSSQSSREPQPTTGSPESSSQDPRKPQATAGPVGSGGHDEPEAGITPGTAGPQSDTAPEVSRPETTADAATPVAGSAPLAGRNPDPQDAADDSPATARAGGDDSRPGGYVGAAVAAAGAAMAARLSNEDVPGEQAPVPDAPRSGDVPEAGATASPNGIAEPDAGGPPRPQRVQGRASMPSQREPGAGWPAASGAGGLWPGEAPEAAELPAAGHEGSSPGAAQHTASGNPWLTSPNRPVSGAQPSAPISGTPAGPWRGTPPSPGAPAGSQPTSGGPAWPAASPTSGSPAAPVPGRPTATGDAPAGPAPTSGSPAAPWHGTAPTSGSPAAPWHGTAPTSGGATAAWPAGSVPTSGSPADPWHGTPPPSANPPWPTGGAAEPTSGQPASPWPGTTPTSGAAPWPGTTPASGAPADPWQQAAPISGSRAAPWPHTAAPTSGSPPNAWPAAAAGGWQAAASPGAAAWPGSTDWAPAPPGGPGQPGGPGPAYPADKPPPRRRGLKVAGILLAIATLAAGSYLGVRLALGGDDRDNATPGAAPQQSVAVDPQGSAAPTEGAPAAPVPVSLAKPVVADRFRLGREPEGVAVSPDNRTVFVADQNSKDVHFVDLGSRKIVAVKVPNTPRFLAVSEDGGRIYVSMFENDFTGNGLAVIDTAKRTVVKTIRTGPRPFEPAVAPDGQVWVPIHNGARVEIFDPRSLTESGRISVPPNPHWVTFSPDGGIAYTANHESSQISVINAKEGLVLRNIKVGRSPHSIAVTPDGRTLIVTNYDLDTVEVFDTGSLKRLHRLAVGKEPQAVITSTDGRHAYVVNEGSDNLSVVDLKAGKVVSTVAVGDSPRVVALSPDGLRLYVTDGGGRTVTVLRTSEK
ncbi:beta-propeller fold lactonase family protein [Actinoplanes aureus]|uniref:Beta-propeller fold lactonase family protein n=1 Tax=Actinoplanes aureus TaxID=2792083 RepID=A0A931FXI5_9ACTN|nr:beta-propeller fold lactonase family protein [Actinoplanes aureus]MBG0562530.1 beta-propeller fold lactonase family protein [Actinoplanes aureus]